MVSMLLVVNKVLSVPMPSNGNTSHSRLKLSNTTSQQTTLTGGPWDVGIITQANILNIAFLLFISPEPQQREPWPTVHHGRLMASGPPLI